MNWTQSKSVTLSQSCVIIFAVILAALDVSCYWLVGYFLSLSRLLDGLWDGSILMILIYSCSIPAWIILWSLWRLLGRIRAGSVFVTENVQDMRRTSWCCFLIGLICLVGTFFYFALCLIAAAAAFMGLIVRIVRNAFQQAISMKDELDFTV